MSFESVRIALQGIAANKLRSALTMLGILIGVASVIVLVAVGTGSKAAVAKQFEALGSNTLTVINTGGFRGAGGARTGTQSRRIDLKDADVAALQDPANCPDCKAVLPILNVPNTTGTYNGATYAPGQFWARPPTIRRYATLPSRRVRSSRPTMSPTVARSSLSEPR